MPKFDTGQVNELSDKFVDCICSNCGTLLMTIRTSKNKIIPCDLTGMKCSDCGSDKFTQRENKTAEKEAEMTEFYQVVRRALLMIVSWIDKRK